MSRLALSRRLLPAALAVVALALCLLGQPVAAAGTSGNNGNKTAGYAYIQVLHAAAGAAAVDVFIDGHKFVTALAYTRATPLIAVPAGVHHFQVAGCTSGPHKDQCRTTNTISGCTGSATASNGCLLDASQTLKANVYGTLALTATAGKGHSLQLIYIPNPAVSGHNGNGGGYGAGQANANNGNATIAFANLAQGVSAVDLAANGQGTLFQNVKPGSYSKGMSLSAKTYTFTLYPASPGSSSSTSGDVLVLPNLGFIAGHTYLIFEYGMAGTSGHGAALSVGSTDVTPMSVIVLPTIR